ncbi:hypothetical protein [Myxosarcina sp. GI1(2024)]
MSSEDFKGAVRAGKLSEALLLAMSKAPELTITTWIASPDTNDQTVPIDNSLRTEINLVAGEINNVVGERMLSNRHPEIERVHFREVKRATDTIGENLETVQKMLRSLAAFQPQSFQLVRKQLPIKSISPNKNSYPSEPEESTITSSDNASIDTAAQSIPSESEFDPDESVVDDLMSLTDLDTDDLNEVTEPLSSEDEDWGDWLDDDSTSEANRDRPEESSEEWQ